MYTPRRKQHKMEQLSISLTCAFQTSSNTFGKIKLATLSNAFILIVPFWGLQFKPNPSCLDFLLYDQLSLESHAFHVAHMTKPTAETYLSFPFSPDCDLAKSIPNKYQTALPFLIMDGKYVGPKCTNMQIRHNHRGAHQSVVSLLSLGPQTLSPGSILYLKSLSQCLPFEVTTFPIVEPVQVPGNSSL